MNSMMIAFSGRYRPLCFQASTLHELEGLALNALQNVGSDMAVLRKWVIQSTGELIRCESYSSTCVEQAGLSVSIYRRPHDKFLDMVTCSMPHCPGADYSAICN